MGKDQELLDAARCGNYEIVERILSHRSKKSGPLASLRRGLGPNVQDSNGYTPLHHACLNSHKEIVALLLEWDASAAIVDTKGCTPLHLAAWSGNTDIVVLLLTHGPSFPSVNQMNYDHESALHSAAQYGHTEVVKILLENRCYPSVRNIRNESPLDLASQYGRLETVQCLLNFHPGLLSDIVRCHSPLHLAAKNGHKHVVKLLLDSGFEINYMTDIGTALHEAAMYGKLEVVKLLLDYGVDIHLENSRKRTVFDILGDLNTSISKQIKSIILQHVTLIQLDSDCMLDPEITPPRQFCSPDFDNIYYDIPPLTDPVEDVERDEKVSSKRYSDPLHCIYQNSSQNTDPYYDNSTACNRSQPPVKPPRKSLSPSCESLCRIMPSKSTPVLNPSPPSPLATDMYFQYKLHPQPYKESRDSKTSIDECAFEPDKKMELPLTADKCVFPETNAESNHFAGLRHGSSVYARIIPRTSEEKRGHRKEKTQNIYENVEISTHSAANQVTDSGVENNGNCFSVMSPFDEKAEWAEIAGIMASFGGSISRESLVSQDVETKFHQQFNDADDRIYENYCPSTIDQWLSQLGLQQYENLFVINGFDDINFLGGNILEEVDLQEIGVKNSAHRQKLCAAAQQLPILHPIWQYKDKNCFPKSVDDWLKSLNLSEYSENFSNNSITDMDRALKLWEVELNTVLKIHKLGHRKRILASIGDKQFGNSIEESDVDVSKLASEFYELEVKSDRTSSSEVPSNESRLQIRPPSTLMKESEIYAPSHQWRHHPDELVMNSCNYIAKYLGSTLVKELRGLESTKMSIQKLKHSTKDIGKIPSIILAISYLGVKFIDAATQQLVCEHEIRNIHCACQDSFDLHYFAYITKEHQTHNHYCHVFSSRSVEMASEIILTLGQAFEVAYQKLMQNKSGRTCREKQIQSFPKLSTRHDL